MHKHLINKSIVGIFVSSIFLLLFTGSAMAMKRAFEEEEEDWLKPLPNKCLKVTDNEIRPRIFSDDSTLMANELWPIILSEVETQDLLVWIFIDKNFCKSITNILVDRSLCCFRKSTGTIDNLNVNLQLSDNSNDENNRILSLDIGNRLDDFKNLSCLHIDTNHMLKGEILLSEPKLKRFRQIIIEDAANIIDEEIRAFSDLRELVIRANNILSDQSLKAIAEKNPYLVSLVLPNVSGITPIGISKITLPELETISFKNINGGKLTVEILLKAFPKLKTVYTDAFRDARELKKELERLNIKCFLLVQKKLFGDEGLEDTGSWLKRAAQELNYQIRNIQRQ